MSEKLKIDPFLNKETLFTIVKDMERRWGLSLVSFLPTVVHDNVELLQKEISKLVYGDVLPNDPSIEFYGPTQLHCTHLTLTRSNAWGPVKEKKFVKYGHDLFESFEIIQNITSHIQFINVRLEILEMSHDGLGIILIGTASDDISKQNRTFLLENLNNELPKNFNLSRRSLDNTDFSKYHKFHCRIGFLKRPIKNYNIFAENVHTMEFKPISFSINEVAIVHHQYRSLLLPHRGSFYFL